MRKKSTILNRCLAAGLFLLQGFLLSAQHITITLDKDTIGFSETVILRLTAEARDFSSYAELPETNGLIVIGRTNNYEMNNSSEKIRFTQTFILSPYRAGTFSIGPAWVQAGSRRIFSNTVSLVVKPGEQSSLSNEIFMRCDPDKKKVMIGEQVTLSLNLYYRIPPWSVQERPLAKPFNGFWYHEGLTGQSYKDSAVLINGLAYVVKTIYKEYVFPNMTGNLSIPAYSCMCVIKQNPYPTGDPLIDEVMGIPIEMKLTSPEVPIEVFPLPRDKPAGFGGDVGTFSLSATIDKENTKVNEAVKINVTISGQGNINFVQLSPLKFPDEVETYSPVSDDSVSIGRNGIEGQKTFAITLIPKKEGIYTLPGITFSYYDPKKKEYVTVQTPEFKLNVAPGDPSQDVSENNLPETFLDGPSYGKIIRRILWIAIPAILLILLYFYQTSKKKRQAEAEENNSTTEVEAIDHEYVKYKPDIHAMLNSAERFLMHGSIQSGIAQLYETLLSAVLFKTELSREEASIHQLRYRLNIKNFPADSITETISTLEELATQRYTNLQTESFSISESLQKTRKLALELLS